MTRAVDLDRLVVVVVARDLEKARRGIGANRGEDVRHTRAAEVADHVPAFDADVTRVLYELRQPPDRIERVFAGARYQSLDEEPPPIEVQFRIVREIGIEREAIERCDVRIREGRRQVRRAKRRRQNACLTVPR
jgi:hypothetical protein